MRCCIRGERQMQRGVAVVQRAFGAVPAAEPSGRSAPPVPRIRSPQCANCCTAAPNTRGSRAANWTIRGASDGWRRAHSNDEVMVR